MKRRTSWLLVGAVLLGWIVFAATCVNTCRRRSESAAVPSGSAARWSPYAEHDAREKALAARRLGPSDCQLAIPGSHDSIPVFPTEAGMDEFTTAAAHGDKQAELVALRSNGAVIVPGGTRCSYVDQGIMRSKVRVLDGAREGSAGWTPTEWTRGE